LQTEPCKRDYILREYPEALLCACISDVRLSYEVATVSRIDKIIGLFCKKSPVKETTFCVHAIKM